MIFNVRYLDTSKWLFGKTKSHWCPKVHIDKYQYFLRDVKINDMFSLMGGVHTRVEEATFLKTNSAQINLRKLMKNHWEYWGYTPTVLSDFAEEIAVNIKDKIIGDSWNPWGHIPEKLNLVILRYMQEGNVIWMGNLFYLGDDPEAYTSGDVINI